MVWGGNRISSYKGVDCDSPNIGESWELSAVSGSETVVLEGEYSGRTIAWLIEHFGADFLGRHVAEQYGGEFPLLVKFIDASSDLSVQVHPDDALAVARGAKRGKSEMWYVVGAAEGAHLISGISQKLTREDYDNIAGTPAIMDYLCQHQVDEGDVFFLPAGRIHTIGAGCFVLEIQQSSDITYRIYDYGRPGLDGKPRQLHTKEAADAIDYRVYSDYKTDYQRIDNIGIQLVSCPYFTTYLYHLTESLVMPMRQLDSFVAVVCTKGDGRVNGVSVKSGESLLIPACADELLMVPGNQGMTLVTSYC